MTDAAVRLRETLLTLPEEDRAWLAAELAASLDGPPDADVAEAWDAEVQRRIAEVRAGKAKLVSWAEASEQLKAALKKP
ncbi:MAG: addiction module protein [Thermoanaerobaculia bacterium]